MRLRLDRQSDHYKLLYNQRTAAERINSQAKALGIENPKVRNIYSVINLNPLTYLVINARALQRVRQVNLKKARAPNDTCNYSPCSLTKKWEQADRCVVAGQSRYLGYACERCLRQRRQWHEPARHFQNGNHHSPCDE